MTHKGIKAALVLGPITLAILAFCAFQGGLISRQRQTALPPEGEKTLGDAGLKSMLAEMSGNKGYDSWSPEKKASFKAEQLRVLESLKDK
jgi:hypothetical protein